AGGAVARALGVDEGGGGGRRSGGPRAGGKRGRERWRGEPPQGRTNRRQSSLGELLDQKGTHLGGIDVGRDEAGADPARQDEGEPAALDLLVLSDEFHQAVGAR